MPGSTARASVQSFDWRTLVAMKRIAPEIERVCLTIESAGRGQYPPRQPGPSPWTAGLDIDDFGGSVPRLVKAADCAVWSPDFRNVTAALVKEAHDLGLKVIPWTVNEMADLEADLSDRRRRHHHGLSRPARAALPKRA